MSNQMCWLQAATTMKKPTAAAMKKPAATNMKKPARLVLADDQEQQREVVRRWQLKCREKQAAGKERKAKKNVRHEARKAAEKGLPYTPKKFQKIAKDAYDAKAAAKMAEKNAAAAVEKAAGVEKKV